MQHYAVTTGGRVQKKRVLFTVWTVLSEEVPYGVGHFFSVLFSVFTVVSSPQSYKSQLAADKVIIKHSWTQASGRCDADRALLFLQIFSGHSVWSTKERRLPGSGFNTDTHGTMASVFLDCVSPHSAAQLLSSCLSLQIAFFFFLLLFKRSLYLQSKVLSGAAGVTRISCNAQ